MAVTLVSVPRHGPTGVSFMPTVCARLLSRLETNDPQLPNEILSEIVAVALLSSRLNEETDQLFIQPKSRVLFSSLAGFGMSCSRFRGILLREWFGTFKVSSIDDIHDLEWRVPSFSIARFVRYVDLAGTPGPSDTQRFLQVKYTSATRSTCSPTTSGRSRRCRPSRTRSAQSRRSGAVSPPGRDTWTR